MSSSNALLKAAQLVWERLPETQGRVVTDLAAQATIRILAEELDNYAHDLEARCAALEEEREEARDTATELMAQNLRLTAALTRHGRHTLNCTAQRKMGIACDCGLSVALAPASPCGHWEPGFGPCIKTGPHTHGTP